MIVEINSKRTRKLKYQTYKVIGENKYELHYLDREKSQRVNIFLKYGGKLAGTIGDMKRYEISFNKLPETVQKQVIEAIEYIEKNGTPMENDESVFSY